MPDAIRRRGAGAAVGATLSLLLFLAAWVGWGLVVQIYNLRQDLREFHLPPRFAGQVLGIAGVDQQGRIVAGGIPGAKRIVVFPLTGRALPSEIAFWRQVRDRAPAGTALRGICVDPGCSELAASRAAGFPILVAADANGIASAKRVGRNGGIIVADSRAHILEEPPLSGRSPAEVLAEVESAK